MNPNDKLIATITTDVTESGAELQTFEIRDLDGNIIKTVQARSLEDLLFSNE